MLSNPIVSIYAQLVENIPVLVSRILILLYKNALFIVMASLLGWLTETAYTSLKLDTQRMNQGNFSLN